MEMNEVNLVLHNAVEKAENVVQKLILCTHQVINDHGEPIIVGFVKVLIFWHFESKKKENEGLVSVSPT